MDELPRQVPQQHPGLGIRAGQGGNFISVRQKPDQDGGWGTLQKPKPLELPLLGRKEVRTRLGYEAESSTDVWAFTTPRPLRLKATRRSDDRYANCVAVALLNGDNRRVASLVASANGQGDIVLLSAGSYKLIAALGIAEKVQVAIELDTTPASLLQGRSSSGSGGLGHLLAQAMLRGVAPLRTPTAAAQLLHRGASRALHLQALIRSGGQLRLQRHLLQAAASFTTTAAAQLRAALRPQSLQAAATTTAGGRGQLAIIRWVVDPDHYWTTRSSGNILEINRSYSPL